jgi:hypothetical protein
MMLCDSPVPVVDYLDVSKTMPRLANGEVVEVAAAGADDG